MILNISLRYFSRFPVCGCAATISGKQAARMQATIVLNGPFAMLELKTVQKK
jgi:hypothetical protein